MTAATGRWLALIAAYLGWLFDGFEMGIFGVVGRFALRSLLPSDQQGHVDLWFGIITALFLFGAAGVGVRFIVDLEAGKPTVRLENVLRVINALGGELQLSGLPSPVAEDQPEGNDHGA